MNDRDAFALVWEGFLSLYRRHPWRVRLLVVSVACPTFLFEWFVLGWKLVALIYAGATIGLLATLGGLVERLTSQQR